MTEPALSTDRLVKIKQALGKIMDRKGPSAFENPILADLRWVIGEVERLAEEVKLSQEGFVKTGNCPRCELLAKEVERLRTFIRCLPPSVAVPDDIREAAEAAEGETSYTPSPKAREKIEKNCDGSRRSQESKVPFHGPLPVNRSEAAEAEEGNQ